MDEIELSDEQQRVYEAVAATESDDRGVRADEIADASGLGEPEVQQPLSALTSEHDLLRELSAGDPDLGPRYRVQDTTGSP